MVEIKLHSVIDLITNSSTEIFVKSENSLEPCKELINELLKVWEPGKTWEDIFDIRIKINADTASDLLDSLEDGDEDNEQFEEIFGNVKSEKDRLRLFTEYVDDVYNERIPQPEWWDDIDAEHHLETVLAVIPKDPKYEKFGELLTQFLYSTDCYEHSWG